jgi:hypothetical protein
LRLARLLPRAVQGLLVALDHAIPFCRHLNRHMLGACSASSPVTPPSSMVPEWHQKKWDVPR